MITDPFAYDLPTDRIAQRPVHPPESAKLLAINRASSEIGDLTFADLPNLLTPADLLILNDTRVIPARFFGTLPGGGAVEFLFVEQRTAKIARCLARPLKKLTPGTRVQIGEYDVVTVRSRFDDLYPGVEIEGAGDFQELCERFGTMPIPPYIRKGLSDQQDRSDYQTVFARDPGSIAAPTASLHFSPELLVNLEQRGVRVAYLTLHVGTASFLPLWADDSAQAPTPAPKSPGPETYIYNAELLARCHETKTRVGRIIAVGTTTTRALESMVRSPTADGSKLSTELFITPGFEFQIVDALITNFHQPRTTHLLLVEAFAGRDLVERAYTGALARAYRFLSYGDGMIFI